MKGGLVVFAAGNSDSDSFCSNYDKMFTVTSVGPDFRRAYYSNYGPAADIAAPGGDYKKGAEIYSTLPGDKYGRMQGTSMACPLQASTQTASRPVTSSMEWFTDSTSTRPITWLSPQTYMSHTERMP